MKKNVFLSCLIIFLFAGVAYAGVPGLEECAKSCATESKDCVKEGEKDCDKLELQCRSQCDNIASYMDCSSICGEGDPQCFENCRNDFRSKVPEYRDWLERNGK